MVPKSKFISQNYTICPHSAEQIVTPCQRFSLASSGSVAAAQRRVLVRAVGAVVVAHAGVDDHDGPLEASAPGTGEGDLGRGGVVRGAAARVRAEAAVPQPEALRAGAALVKQAHGPRGQDAGLAHSPLGPRHWTPGGQQRAAGAHFAQARLQLQSAAGVLVGHSGGDAGAAALRTGAPLGALLHTAGPGRGGHGAQSVQGVSPGQRGPPSSGLRGCDGVLDDRVLQALADPLSAAPPGQSHKLWAGAVGGGQPASERAGVDTADPPGLTPAEPVTGGTKRLALCV